MSLHTYLTHSAAVLTRAAEEIGQSAVDALTAGQALLVCGNGGSAADAMHITCELVGPSKDSGEIHSMQGPAGSRSCVFLCRAAAAIVMCGSPAD